MSFVDPTLPLAEMNKVFDCCSRKIIVCVCGVKVFSGMCEFNVNICYLTKLKLASGNAYSCNDRSGIHVKKKMYFFNTYFKKWLIEEFVMDDS